MEASSGYQRNVKRETAGSAFIQVVIVAALVGGGIFFYAKRESEKKRVMDLAVAAKEKTEGDDAPSLIEAKKKFSEIGSDEKLMANDAILSALAEIDAQMYQAYGVKESKDSATRYLAALRERNVRTAERYAAEAYLMLGDGRANEAEALLMDLVNTKGARHAKLLHALSIAKLAQGKAKEAVVAAQEGEKLSTTLVRLPIAEGDALLALGNMPSAANAYLKAKKLNPDHMRARTALTLVAAVSRQGKAEMLEKELDRLLEEANAKHNNAPPPRVKGFIEYAKGEVYLVDNHAEEALKQADAAIATDAQPAALALRGRALAKLGKIDEAKKAFEDALAISPSSLPIAKSAYEVLLRAGKGDEGIAFLEKVQSANPDNGLAYAELALAQAHVGKGKEALANVDKAIEKLGNAHDLAVFAKARALQADGQLDKAREVYGEALGYHQTPEWPELFYAMGQLRAEEKNYDDAALNFQQAITLWDKQGGSRDAVADAYEGLGKAYDGAKKKKESAEALQKAADIRAGKV